jgi:hypothetical protein
MRNFWRKRKDKGRKVRIKKELRAKIEGNAGGQYGWFSNLNIDSLL